MLAVVHIPYDPGSMTADRLEDELVRHGARHARIVEEGTVSVTVDATSTGDAVALARKIMARVSTNSPFRSDSSEHRLDPANQETADGK